MKKLSFFAAAALVVCSAAGADEAQWLTDLSKAKTEAHEQKKMVLLDFNGSDWCPPCKALRTKVFSSPEFVSYARTNLVLVDVDFPQHKSQAEELKKANQALAEAYSVEAFPTVVVLSSDGKQLKKETGYSGQDPKAFIAELERLRRKG